MIRQAISCDMCGAEKRQTNHWFVAYAHADELRVSGWNATGRMRSGAKHLCGQTCLHKLLDEFIARTASSRSPALPDPGEREEPAATDTSLTSKAAYPVPVEIPPVRPLQVVPAAVIAIAPSHMVEEPRATAPLPAFEEPLNYPSRRRRQEAWDRERERCASQTTHRKTS